MTSELVPYRGGHMTERIELEGKLTSYDTRDRPGQVALYLAMTGTDFAIDDLVGTTIEVVHIVCHPAQLVNAETGEIRDTTRTVLIGQDGTRYSTHSDTVRRCVQRYAEIFQAELPFNPPARFRVVKQPRKGKPGGYLLLVPEDLLDAAGEIKAKPKGKSKGGE